MSTPSQLVDQYKRLLLELIVARCSATPSLAEEAALAGQREELWDQIPSNDQIELEKWIESQMRPPAVEAPTTLDKLDAAETFVSWAA